MFACVTGLLIVVYYVWDKLKYWLVELEMEKSKHIENTQTTYNTHRQHTYLQHIYATHIYNTHEQRI